MTCGIMRNFLCVLLFCVFEHTPASAGNIIDTDVVGNYDIEKHTIITENGSLSGGTINVTRSVLIENGGEIHSGLNICNNCNVSIRNFGIYDAVVSLESGATISQVITKSADVTRLNNIGANYDVYLQNTQDILNWTDVVSNTSGANRQYIMDNAKIHMDSIVSIDSVQIDGIVYVYTDNMPNTDMVVFDNPSGEGTVRVVFGGANSLMFIETYKKNGDVFVRATRSMDYARILTSNNITDILRKLRQEPQNNRLFKKLDSANSVNAINHIISKSVKFNPIKLMQPIKTIFLHKTLENIHTDRNGGLGIMPIGVFSNNMLSIGIEPNIDINIFNNLSMKIYGGISNLRYADDINEYGAVVYNLGADMVYMLPYYNFIRVLGGVSLTSFDSGTVVNNRKQTTNPNGFIGYGITEFGHKFTIGDNYYIAPFALAGGNHTTVLYGKDKDLYIGSGVDVGTWFEIDGLKYSYDLRGVLRTDGSIGGNINVSMWSVMDDAGANFEFGILYDDTMELSYHISLNAKFNF